MLDIRSIGNLQLDELLKKAKELKIDLNYEKVASHRLCDVFFQVITKMSEKEKISGSGVLEILEEGFGFLRSPNRSYSIRHDDIHVSHHHIRKNGLKTGDFIECTLSNPRSNEKHFGLQKVISVNDNKNFESHIRPNFDYMTPIFPDKKFNLELPEGIKVDYNEASKDVTSRLIPIITPIGKGQRCLVVAPPRAGKTLVLQNIACAIEKNHPECKLIVLLIDERPEEVTYMRDMIKNGDVISSTFDEPAFKHIQVAELTIERAKRLVESGQDVVILLDSITRLARAYNTVVPSSGKLLTGGVDSNALQKPKKFFGAARNIKGMKSLTIIATALIETGSRMDEVIFEEFKGTGNSEIVLSRQIAERRIFPAVDILKSGTRKDNLILDNDVLQKTFLLRKILSNMDSIEAAEFLINKIKMTKNNDEFFEFMRVSSNGNQK